ncbi:MAG: hypothetical protein ACFFCS_15070, partial [Candidatus Hodarchaeota archaeon]
GGLIVGGIFYWAIIVKGALIKHTLKKKGGIHLSIAGIGSMAFIVYLLIQIISWADIDVLLNFESIIAGLDGVFSNYPVWEWLLFIMVGVQTMLLFMIIPDFKQITELKRQGINKLVGFYDEADYRPFLKKKRKNISARLESRPR